MLSEGTELLVGMSRLVRAAYTNEGHVTDIYKHVLFADQAVVKSNGEIS